MFARNMSDTTATDEEMAALSSVQVGPEAKGKQIE